MAARICTDEFANGNYVEFIRLTYKLQVVRPFVFNEGFTRTISTEGSDVTDYEIYKLNLAALAIDYLRKGGISSHVHSRWKCVSN